MRLARLFPGNGETTPVDAAADVRPLGHVPDDRPYLVLNMVATADGHATIGGRSGPIGNEADRQLFHELRARFDAVMVGAGTLRAERYGRLVRDPERRERRARAGLAPDPIACVVSGRLDLPTDAGLFNEPDQRVILATGSERALDGVSSSVEYLRASETPLDAGWLVRALRREHGIGSVLCEGGPTLNAELLRAGVVDELMLCVAPKLAGGPEALTIVTGTLLETVRLELVWLLESEHHLFLRYRVAP